MVDVPFFRIIGKRCFASAKDKAALDKYFADKNEYPAPVSVVWPAALVATCFRRGGFVMQHEGKC